MDENFVELSLVPESCVDQKVDRYVIFDKKDFEETLSNILEWFEEVFINDNIKEYVYLVKIKGDNKFFLIYSSIDKDTKLDRPCRKDSIKIVPVIGCKDGRLIFQKLYKTTDKTRINRTENWRKVLKERINEAANKMKENYYVINHINQLRDKYKDIKNDIRI